MRWPCVSFFLTQRPSNSRSSLRVLWWKSKGQISPKALDYMGVGIH